MPVIADKNMINRILDAEVEAEFIDNKNIGINQKLDKYRLSLSRGTKLNTTNVLNLQKRPP